MIRQFFKKIVLSSIIVGVVSVSLVGCGEKATVESVFNDAKSAYSDIKSVSLFVGVDIDGNVELEKDTSMNLALNANINIEGEKDSGSHYSGNVDFSILGITKKLDVDTYNELNGDTQTVYSYDSENDTWTLSDSYIDKDDESKGLMESLYTTDYSSIYGNLTLDKKTEKVSGVDAYHISGKVKGSDLSKISSQLEGSLDSDLDISSKLDDSYVDLDFYFSEKDSKLLSMKLDFSDINLTGLMQDNEDTTVNFDKFCINIVINDTNNYTFEVPDDVVNEAVYDYDSDFNKGFDNLM